MKQAGAGNAYKSTTPIAPKLRKNKENTAKEIVYNQTIPCYNKEKPITGLC